MSNDAISPELSFFSYAFVSVFNIFRTTGPNRVYKRDGRVVHFRGGSPECGRTQRLDSDFGAKVGCSPLDVPADKARRRVRSRNREILWGHSAAEAAGIGVDSKNKWMELLKRSLEAQGQG
jgi:hypothetical protein